MAEARSLTDLLGFRPRRQPEADAAVDAGVPAQSELTYPTRALHKFLSGLHQRDNPLIVDLGPVVGSNVTFFGEQLGCRIRVEDVAADIDRHMKAGTLEELVPYFNSRFTQAPESVDGILCWDILDYLDRPAAESLATALQRLLRPDGYLLGLFSTAETREQVYTKYVVVDESTLRYRTYPALRARQRNLLNGDIIRLFKHLRVTDSFLMKSKVREMLFRKPGAKA